MSVKQLPFICFYVFFASGSTFNSGYIDASEIISKVTRGECQILKGPWFDSNFNTTCRQAFATFDKVVGSWRFARCVGRGALVLQIMVTWKCWHHSGMMTLPLKVLIWGGGGHWNCSWIALWKLSHVIWDTKQTFTRLILFSLDI